MCGDGKNVVELVTGHCLTNSKSWPHLSTKTPSCAQKKKKKKLSKTIKAVIECDGFIYNQIIQFICIFHIDYLYQL